MTKTEAAKIPANTDEFDAAVDLLSDLAEAGDKEAGEVLKFLLTRMNDFIVAAAY